MAINKPIIDAGPTKQRGHVLDQPVTLHPVGPGEAYRVSRYESVTVNPPDREGQVFFHVISDGRNRLASMYVGVNVSGTLTWVLASLNPSVNGYTGEPIDPIYD